MKKHRRLQSMCAFLFVMVTLITLKIIHITTQHRNEEGDNSDSSRLKILEISLREKIEAEAKISKLEAELESSVPAVAMRPLPPVHMNSSWIGNLWIPPMGYRLYSTREILNYFSHHSILFVGDSTARRSYATLFAILNATENSEDVPVNDVNDPSIIDVNKGRITEPCSEENLILCRQIPLSHTSNSRFDLYNEACLNHLADTVMDDNSFLRRRLHEYTLVIFVMGPWEVDSKVECRPMNEPQDNRRNSTDNIFRTLFQVNDDNSNDGINSSSNKDKVNTTFLWRTWGSPGTQDSSENIKMWTKARTHNDYVKHLVDNYEISRKNAGTLLGSVSYLDWGQVMLPRLFPEEKRIAGDIIQHYGLQARLTFVQMLINHLVERDRQKKLRINPWLPTDHRMGNDTLYDPEHFMTNKVVSPTELEELELLRASFCSECTFATGISCGDREYYVRIQYGTTELESFTSAMKNPACNKSIVKGA